MLPETAYGVNNIGGAPFVRNTSLLSSSYNLTTSGAPTFSQTRHASLCNVTWLDGHTTTQKGKRLQLWLYERCSTGEIYGAVVRQEYLN